MDFISNIIRRYIIQNDTKAINIITPEKLQVEQKVQKPRRSVLKEFDPFAPESPQLNQTKSKRITIDEEDTFEDAQTSFTNFHTKSTNASTIPIEGDGKNPIFNTSCLIPDLRDYVPTNPNDISDACYVEAVENLSEAPDLLANATHSDDEVVFQTKCSNGKMDMKTEIEEEPQNMESHQNSFHSQIMNTTIEVPKINVSLVEVSDRTEEKPQNAEEAQNILHSKDLNSTMVVSKSDKTEEEPQNMSGSKDLNSTMEVPKSDKTKYEPQNMSGSKDFNSTVEIPKLGKTEDESRNTEKESIKITDEELDVKNEIEKPQNIEQVQNMPGSENLNSTVDIPKSNESLIVETSHKEEMEVKDEELQNIQEGLKFANSKGLNSTIKVPKTNESFTADVFRENTETTKDVKIKSSVDRSIKASVNLNSTFDTGINPTETEIKRNSCNNIPNVPEQVTNAKEGIDVKSEDINEHLNAINHENIDIKYEASDIKLNKTCTNVDKNIGGDIDKTFEATGNTRKTYVKENCFNTVCKPDTENEGTSKPFTNAVLNETYIEKQKLNSTFEKIPNQGVNITTKSSITNLNVTYAEKEPQNLNETLEALQEKGDFVNSTMNGTFDSRAANQSSKTRNTPDQTISITKQNNLDGTFNNKMVVSPPSEKHHQTEDEDSDSEKEMESLKQMEQMANSLDQTIDVEESAISQEVNTSLSPNNSSEADVLNKTIEGNVESQVVPVSVVDPVVTLKEVPAKSKLSSRVSCRPSIKTVTNKSEIESCNKTVNDTPPTTPSIEQNRLKNPCSEENVIEEYKNKNAALNNRIVELQEEMSKMKSEKDATKKQALSQKLTKSDEERKYKLLLEKYNHVIMKQDQDLLMAKAEYEQCNQMFLNTEMAFSNLFEKYQKTKYATENFKKTEEILKANLQSAEDQLAKLEARYTALEIAYNEQCGRAKEQIQKEKEKQDLENTKLQAIVKRFEIKISSLETALKQKTEECQALSALCDDITGHP